VQSDWQYIYDLDQIIPLICRVISVSSQCTLNASGRRDAATRAMVSGCAVEILFLEPPRDGLAGRDGLRAGLMPGSFTVVKRNAFATGRERVFGSLVLEDVVGARA
jgi:hypothetical protein